ncbi:hypothetical protein [Lacticaseibacillus saniviri]|uniref:Uncharacterized protein n=1 Tax=Lacticaseibacillus saniviri JCM 17471 = DSM 24301 TaxID=1293598 RepID=A0A0R2MWH2_9LACO|nr:hypothetical protein [Lacticaseibacillus saniviri]KRO17857.1 hypothetical protein IV56_GL001984 [Lacticaseibacillus saniviri JCM 17471 = DSM 24301]MCG4282742.1 hypothetical protein [Lacticaseibacillus saniviri]
MQLNLIDMDEHEHKVTLTDDALLTGRRQQRQLTPTLLNEWALQHHQATMTLPQSKGTFNVNQLAKQLADALGWPLPAKQIIPGQFTLRGFDATTGVVAVDVSADDDQLIFTVLLKDAKTPLAARIARAKIQAATSELYAIEFSPQLRVALPVAELKKL